MSVCLFVTNEFDEYNQYHQNGMLDNLDDENYEISKIWTIKSYQKHIYS